MLNARLNARLARTRIEVRRGHLTTPLAGRTFDVVISNPPYVPVPEESRRRRAARAWDAGPDGRDVVDQLCDDVARLLRPHGVLLLIHSGLCRPEETDRRLSCAGLSTAVCDRVRIPFGPVIRERLPWLRSRGLIGADEETEELVITRAERKN